LSIPFFSRNGSARVLFVRRVILFNKSDGPESEFESNLDGIRPPSFMAPDAELFPKMRNRRNPLKIQPIANPKVEEGYRQ